MKYQAEIKIPWKLVYYHVPSYDDPVMQQFIQTLDNSLIYKEITKEEYISLAKEYDVINKSGFNLAQMALSVPGSLMLGDKSYLLTCIDDQEKMKIKNFIINLHEGKNIKRVVTQIKKRLDCDLEIIDNKIVVTCTELDLDQIVEIKSILSIEIEPIESEPIACEI